MRGKIDFILLLSLVIGSVAIIQESEPIRDSWTVWKRIWKEMERIKADLSNEYYSATYHEKKFSPPALPLRKLALRPLASRTIIDHGSSIRNKIALTFDACSTLLPSRFDSAVAKILIETQTPATIFLGGKWVLDRPQDARWLASIPFFEIGNHTYLHSHLPQVSDERLKYELLWAQEAIYTITGKIPKTFRPPYVEYDRRTLEVAASMGLLTVIGDLPSGDPDPHASKERLITYLNDKTKNGSIIIMHINEGGKHTAEALLQVIGDLKFRGFEFVTIENLLKE